MTDVITAMQVLCLLSWAISLISFRHDAWQSVAAIRAASRVDAATGLRGAVWLVALSVASFNARGLLYHQQLGGAAETAFPALMTAYTLSIIASHTLRIAAWRLRP